MIGPLLSLLLLAAPAAQSAEPGRDSYAAGQAAFAQGEFDKALKALDAAAAEASRNANEALLVQAHLLRGQCFAALPDVARAEEAFLKALEVDPGARLDPARVRPSVVNMLEKVRGQATGELKVHADEPSAEVWLDEQRVGTAPARAMVKIGKHVVLVKAADGRASDRHEVVVRARTSHEVSLRLPPAPAPVPAVVEPARSPLEGLALFVDVRGALEPVPPAGTGLAGATELGIGAGLRNVAGSLHAGRYGQSWAFALRLTGKVPELFSIVGLHGSLDVPAILVDGNLSPAIGGAIGLDFAVSSWLEPFVEAQYRHVFRLPAWEGATAYATNPVLVGAGARLSFP